MSRVTDIPMQEKKEPNHDGSKHSDSQQQNTPLIPFHPHIVARDLPNDLCEMSQHEHEPIFNVKPTVSTTYDKKPLHWKAAWKKIVGHYIHSLLPRFGRNTYPENFQRVAHVEIDVPGVGPVSEYFRVLFDLDTPHNYIGGKCTALLGLEPKSGTMHLIRGVRWHTKADKMLKEPRLYFNDLKYEEGDFIYADSLGKFDLVIGWKSIQALQLLEPKDDIAAGGFRQLPRPVDSSIAKINQPAVTQARDQEWERMRQHAEKKARDAAAAATAAKRN